MNNLLNLLGVASLPGARLSRASSSSARCCCRRKKITLRIIHHGVIEKQETIKTR
jgi:hypothetical protein